MGVESLLFLNMLAPVPRLFIEVGAHIGPTFVSIASTVPRTAGAMGKNAKQRTFFPLEISMLSIFRRLMKSEHGATAIEYTLIASLIAVAAIAAMRTVGTNVNGVLTNVASALN